MKPGLPVVIGMVRGELPVAEHLHLVGLGVDLVDVGRADVELDVPVLLAEDPGAGRHAVDLDVDGHVGAGAPVGLGPPVHLVVGDPVPGARLLGRRGDAQVLLDRGLVGHRDVERHDHRHAHAHGLAGQRRHRRVGLLVQGQVDGVEARTPRDGGPVGAPGHGRHGIVGAGLEQRVGDPRDVVARHLAGDLAGGRVDRDLAQGAAVGLQGQPGVDGHVAGAEVDVGHHLDRWHLGRRRLLRSGRGGTGRARLLGGVRRVVDAVAGGERGRHGARQCDSEQAGPAKGHVDGTPRDGRWLPCQPNPGKSRIPNARAGPDTAPQRPGAACSGPLSGGVSGRARRGSTRKRARRGPVRRGRRR